MNRLMNRFTGKRIPAVIMAVLIMLSSLAAAVVPVQAASTAPRAHVAVGYWLGGNGGSNKTLAQADPGWDVINVSFIETKGNHYTPNLNMDLSAVYSGTEAQQIAAFKQDIKTVQARGTKVVISCGGQNGVVHIDNATQRDTFLNGVKAIINEYGFDGFDVDFEGSSIACMNTDKIGNLVTQQSINLEYILRDLKSTYGTNFIVSAAPEYCYVQGGALSTGNFGAFLPVLDACRDILTYIHPQYYNGYDFDFKWLEASANAGAPFNNVYSAEGYVRLSEMLITGFVTKDKGTFAGLRPDQVAFGVPARTGAGGGAQSVSVYASALRTLLAEYPDFRGIMTWSIGWDETNNNSFINTIAPIIAAANGSTLTNAQTPTITSQPTDKTVSINGTAALAITATVTKGTLSYQWYTAPSKSSANGTIINGATSATYNAPTSTAGTSYYYCIVTNTDNTATGNKTAKATSSAVSVVVNSNAQTDAAAPTITVQPSDKTVTVDTAVSLSVTANGSGTLSYQWYVASSKNNTTGTPISGATSATYNVPTSAEGTYYYYCVITNTDNAATGNKTAITASNAVSVTVTAQSEISEWSPTTIYVKDDKVTYQGLIYKAKWWTQNNIPGTEQWGPWELIQ